MKYTAFSADFFNFALKLTMEKTTKSKIYSLKLINILVFVNTELPKSQQFFQRELFVCIELFLKYDKIT